MKPLFLLLSIFPITSAYYFSPHHYLPNTAATSLSSNATSEAKTVHAKASLLKTYVANKGLSQEYAFLINMRIPSGRNRFFIYDLTNDSIVTSGLVAHGSCVTTYLEKAQFSNVVGGGCSSMGRYKIGYSYKGRFGKAFKLHGLDSTNSNAFQRSVVLHSYTCIPESEVYPQVICNSLGCPMVSPSFLKKASFYILTSKKPICLWIYG